MEGHGGLVASPAGMCPSHSWGHAMAPGLARAGMGREGDTRAGVCGAVAMRTLGWPHVGQGTGMGTAGACSHAITPQKGAGLWGPGRPQLHEPASRQSLAASPSSRTRRCRGNTLFSGTSLCDGKLMLCGRLQLGPGGSGGNKPRSALKTPRGAPSQHGGSPLTPPHPTDTPTLREMPLNPLQLPGDTCGHGDSRRGRRLPCRGAGGHRLSHPMRETGFMELLRLPRVCVWPHPSFSTSWINFPSSSVLPSGSSR